MNHSTPGLPVHHQFLCYQVGDAIQPSHPLSSPSPPAPNPSLQHQGLFQWVNSSQCMTSQIYYSSSAGGASLKAQTVKNLPARQETRRSSGSGRSPGEGTGYPLQYSCLENSVDRGAWQTTVHGVAELNTTEQLTHTFIKKGSLNLSFLSVTISCVWDFQVAGGIFSHNIQYNISTWKWSRSVVSNSLRPHGL